MLNIIMKLNSMIENKSKRELKTNDDEISDFIIEEKDSLHQYKINVLITLLILTNKTNITTYHYL